MRTKAILLNKLALYLYIMNSKQHTSLFAIVDIETTGSYASANGITEIAIYIYDGNKIVDEYQTLINPQQDIPHYIETLTGIHNDMVKDAPVFEDVAFIIYEKLKDKVFVAHNVNFDYNFVSHQLKTAGFDLKAPKLCTVRLARKYLPGFASYSLGKLCDHLGINITSRHRAAGDARATVTLFEHIIQKSGFDELFLSAKFKVKEQRFPSHVNSKDLEKLPGKPGVYFFRDKAGKLIYVGKATNIRKRVNSHFIGENPSARRQKFINEIFHIDFEETGTELMALLKECHYIKQNWPTYNNALKKYDPKFGLIDYIDNRGLLRLCIIKMKKGLTALKYFQNVYESTAYMLKLIHEFDLSFSLCSFYAESPAREDQKKILTEIDFDDYNEKATHAVEFIKNDTESFVLIDNGRNPEEYSYIYYRNNSVYALGFTEKDNSFNSTDDLVKNEDLCHSNYYMCNLVKNYALKFPYKVKSVTD